MQNVAQCCNGQNQQLLPPQLSMLLLPTHVFQCFLSLEMSKALPEDFEDVFYAVDWRGNVYSFNLTDDPSIQCYCPLQYQIRQTNIML
ncbi:hypothetical protein E1A91_D09G202100v1 [Gossypium mustelinum]|uniref:Uncharacterized protein n=1 Tax=Gossypium mustelinum TaxID=34275 RepID=A0A5D2TN54_GOSMU|nr:hypothetical protein E1A91_D09G202100v1 [Gossypium mustelinum]